MTYKLNAKPRTSSVGRLMTRMLLVTVGVMIGISSGFYFAVRTLPLPDSQVIYVSR